MDTPPPGHCPACSRAVTLPGLRPSGVWHGVDPLGEAVGGDLFEVQCPACGARLTAYEEAGDRERVDPARVTWQSSEAAGA